MSIGKVMAAKMSEQGIPPEGEPEVTLQAEAQVEEKHTIPLPPKARKELKALLRTQNDAQERIRLVLSTLEEALEVPPGWVIRDVEEGFVKMLPDT